MAKPSGPGATDLERAVASLARRLPTALAPLAAAAYDLRWTWAPGGAATFAAVDAERWEACGHNPVRLLVETTPERLDEAADDPDVLARVAELRARLDQHEHAPGTEPDLGTVAFLCAEFGLHESLPTYSGGLGVLAGDILKQADDLGLPLVGVGLLYRNGYFHQRIDEAGAQHASWSDVDPDLLPVVRVHDDASGEPVRVTVPVLDRDVAVGVWRASVGQVPLYLLDTDLPENQAADRWITARLYDGNPEVRLAQYAVLGVGGARVLQRLGIEPSVVHVNEGHPILATAELLSRQGLGADPSGLAEHLVFTTHTPVPAGNETYPADVVRRVLGGLADETGDGAAYLALGRAQPDDPDSPVGMTQLALRCADRVNAVSERHGAVARQMWRGVLAPEGSDDDVPITHVTNGVHLPTWTGHAVAACLDEHLGPRWRTTPADPGVWAAVDEIPGAELWAARNRARADLVALVHQRVVQDRLRRGEDRARAEAVLEGFQEDRLTLGFARRIATYKRLDLLVARPERLHALLTRDDGVQLVLAGKAHPRDEAGQGVLQRVYRVEAQPEVDGRIALVEDYDLSVARTLVSGCDVWLNVPRPPEEASGTSGMKAAANGCLNLSVLDGWWAEAHDGSNGWAIDGSVDPDGPAQDERHADALLDLLEGEVLPRFHDRDADGVPTAWLAMVRADLRSLAPRFSAARMVQDYAERLYPST